MTLGLDRGLRYGNVNPNTDRCVGYAVISYRAAALHAYRQPVGWNLGFA